MVNILLVGVGINILKNEIIGITVECSLGRECIAGAVLRRLCFEMVWSKWGRRVTFRLEEQCSSCFDGSLESSESRAFRSRDKGL